MYNTFALRYFRAKKSTNAINIISWVSVVAIAVGAASLVLVLSVYNGFEGLVKSLYSSFYSDIKISPAAGKTIFVSPEQLQALSDNRYIDYYTRVTEEKAAVINGNHQTIVIMKGVDDNYNKVTGVAGKIVRGKFNLGTSENPYAVLGAGVEGLLDLNTINNIYQITTYLPKKAVASNEPSASLPQGNILPVGTFAIQQDFDNKYIITNLQFMKRQMGFAENEYSGIEIKLKKGVNTREAKESLKKQFNYLFKIEDRYEQNKTLYSVMQVEKWVIFGILAMILIIAAFNMIGALTMIVLEKKKDIQVLQAMGADRNFIKKIFLSEGILLAGVGAIAGMLPAIILCLLQQKYKFIPLQGDSFVINYYPVKILMTDLITIALTIFLVALSASWVPANKAANQPFELKV
ncbi:MAG TPA: FtsX-like permease family protein [Chitinophagaceae bacterium]|nr:FtsX-like permease family protein [Chitinophagaceae bacterium]